MRKPLHEPTPRFPMPFFLHPTFLCYKDHFPLPHSRTHPSLFHPNRSVLSFHSILISHQAISCQGPLPARRTCRQSFVGAHHYFFFLFSISCFVQSLSIRC